MGIHSLCLPEGVDVNEVLEREASGEYTVESQDNPRRGDWEELRGREAAYYRVLRRRKRSEKPRRLHEAPSYGD